MSAPFFLVLVACIGCAVYAMYLRNLERPEAEYHIYHGPNSGCADCDPIRRCSECPNLTRPSRTLVADYPGTLQRNGTTCVTCYKRALKRSGEDPATRPTHEYNLAGLASFLRRRNERAEAMLRRAYYEERISA